MTKFVLALTGNIRRFEENDTVIIETRGWLSSVWGAAVIMDLLSADSIIDIGSWLTPIVFECRREDVVPLKDLLEECLQVPGFDRDLSQLYVR